MRATHFIMRPKPREVRALKKSLVRRRRVKDFFLAGSVTGLGAGWVVARREYLNRPVPNVRGEVIITNSTITPPIITTSTRLEQYFGAKESEQMAQLMGDLLLKTKKVYAQRGEKLTSWRLSYSTESKHIQLTTENPSSEIVLEKMRPEIVHLVKSANLRANVLNRVVAERIEAYKAKNNLLGATNDAVIVHLEKHSPVDKAKLALHSGEAFTGGLLVAGLTAALLGGKVRKLFHTTRTKARNLGRSFRIKKQKVGSEEGVQQTGVSEKGGQINQGANQNGGFDDANRVRRLKGEHIERQRGLDGEKRRVEWKTFFRGLHLTQDGRVLSDDVLSRLADLVVGEESRAFERTGEEFPLDRNHTSIQHVLNSVFGNGVNNTNSRGEVEQVKKRGVKLHTSNSLHVPTVTHRLRKLGVGIVVENKGHHYVFHFGQKVAQFAIHNNRNSVPSGYINRVLTELGIPREVFWNQK